MQKVSDIERQKLLDEKSYHERCTTSVKDIQVGQTVRGFFARGFVEVFVADVKVNPNTYDKNNCGVWVKGEVLRMNDWHYPITLDRLERGYDSVFFHIHDMVEVFQPMLRMTKVKNWTNSTNSDSNSKVLASEMERGFLGKDLTDPLKVLTSKTTTTTHGGNDE